MKFPSLSMVFSIGFLCYILHSMYTLYALFRPPTCTGSPCFRSDLTGSKNMQLTLFSGSNGNPTSSQSVVKLGNIKRFDVMRETEKSYTFALPKETKKNGTLFLFVVLTNDSGNVEWDGLRQSSNAVIKKIPISRYQLPRPDPLNLLSDSEPTRKSSRPEQRNKPITHLNRKVYVTILTEMFSLSAMDVPAELARDIRITPGNTLMPIVRSDFLKERLADLVEVGNADYEATITMYYSPSSVGKMKLLAHIEHALGVLRSAGFSEKDIDEVKSIFSDTNLYLLCGTIVISSVHLLIDFLSFKNDILFWKRKRHYAGLSTRSTLWRTFSHFIIFLYLLDEETSLLVLIPTGIGALIELWKAKKILKLEIGLSGVRYKVDRTLSTDIQKEERDTKDLDKQAMTYLSYVLYPLCAAGAAYSLVYLPHKSWYSWTISSLVNGVYAFGFLFMLPQLFINYKLKSVAALPWRAFMYKAFNTFIDDIFAFIITMPTAHRFACFRDDIIFLVYLYQRWLYPVDKSRTDDGHEIVDSADTQTDKHSTETSKKDD